VFEGTTGIRVDEEYRGVKLLRSAKKGQFSTLPLPNPFEPETSVGK
tara:strand:+ start:372 stop:509 length:138 start_codon:yes stop_codon:yes gene_type:complete